MAYIQFCTLRGFCFFWIVCCEIYASVFVRLYDWFPSKIKKKVSKKVSDWLPYIEEDIDFEWWFTSLPFLFTILPI